MTLSDDQVHGWIAALVDRTAGQLRAELAVLVRQVQNAAPAPEVARPDGSVSRPVAGFDSRGAAAGGPGLRSLAGSGSQTLAAEVLEAMTALDEATSLSDILTALADRASVHANRVLLLVNRGHGLSGWRWHGYTADPGDATTLEIAGDDDGIVMRAAKSGVTQTGRGPATDQPGGDSGAENRTAIAVPLRVEGQVVAVLYAEAEGVSDAEQATAADAPDLVRRSWAEVVGVLARHAARCLESMTARRLPELMRLPAEGGSTPSERDR